MGREAVRDDVHLRGSHALHALCGLMQSRGQCGVVADAWNEGKDAYEGLRVCLGVGPGIILVPKDIYPVYQTLLVEPGDLRCPRVSVCELDLVIVRRVDHRTT